MSNTLLSCILPLHGFKSLNKAEKQGENSFIESGLQKGLKQDLILFQNEPIYGSSLLFQACLSLVSSKREAIIVSTSQFKSLPLNIHNMPKPEIDRLKLIKFKYFQSFQEIINFLSEVHMEVNYPSIIAIDGLQNFLNRDKSEQDLDRIREFSLICSHLKDAVKYIRSKNPLCALLVSCTPLENDHFARLYFDSICHLKPLVKDLHYEVHCLNSTKGLNVEEFVVSLKINQNSIFLDEVKFSLN